MLEPGGGLLGGGVEVFEERGFFFRGFADGGFEHVEELVVFVAHAVPVENAGTAGGDDHGEVVDGGDGVAGVAVDVFDDAVEDVEGVVFGLLPALGEGGDDEVLAEDPHPELVDLVLLAIPNDDQGCTKE